MADETNMPKVARRKGGADTLFSAEWFDDNDEFTGTKPDGGGARENVSIPSSSPAPPEEKEASGPPMVLIAVGLAVVFLGGGCVLGAVAAGVVFALGLVPV